MSSTNIELLTNFPEEIRNFDPFGETFYDLEYVATYVFNTAFFLFFAIAKPWFILAANFSSHNPCTARDARDVWR